MDIKRNIRYKDAQVWYTQHQNNAIDTSIIIQHVTEKISGTIGIF